MNQQIAKDAEGYLVNPEDWNADIAHELAKEEGIELDGTCWAVINFMRKYYEEHQITPDVRHVVDHLAIEKRCDKHVAKDIIFHLFPYGYVKQACKIAGMQRPRAWSTG